MGVKGSLLLLREEHRLQANAEVPRKKLELRKFK